VGIPISAPCPGGRHPSPDHCCRWASALCGQAEAGADKYETGGAVEAMAQAFASEPFGQDEVAGLLFAVLRGP